MKISTRRNLLGRIATILVVAIMLAGCGEQETGATRVASPPSPTLPPTLQPTALPSIQASPTSFSSQSIIDPNLDLAAAPVDVPLEVEIPALAVKAPVLGVGLAPDGLMDTPKGPIGDPVWSKVYWYRGGGIPGEVGTATIAGHVNDPLGQPMRFARLEKLIPGDLIFINFTQTSLSVQFTVDQIKVYSLKESSEPATLTQIYGAGPVLGIEPQPAPDGRAHLTLITCAGNIVDGEFDHHTVVYATRSK